MDTAIIQKEIESLKAEVPAFGDFTFNEFYAPHLYGLRAFDLGLALLFVEELGAYSSAPKMASLLSVSDLTCKNWITKKLVPECLCKIEWEIRPTGRQYVVHSHGIFSMDFYSKFRPYVRLVIQFWLEKSDGKASAS